MSYRDTYHSGVPKKRSPCSLLAALCFCVSILAIIALTVTLIVTSGRSTTPTPTPTPTPVLVCDAFSDVEFPAPVSVPCSDLLVPSGQCVAQADLSFICQTIEEIYQVNPSVLDNPTQLQGPPEDGQCVQDGNPCTIAGLTVCERGDIGTEIEIFQCVAPTPTPAPTPAPTPGPVELVCADFDPTSVVSQSDASRCDEPNQVPGGCAAFNTCIYSFYLEGQSPDDVVAGVATCAAPECLDAGGACSCTETGVSCRKEIQLGTNIFFENIECVSPPAPLICELFDTTIVPAANQPIVPGFDCGESDTLVSGSCQFAGDTCLVSVRPANSDPQTTDRVLVQCPSDNPCVAPGESCDCVLKGLPICFRQVSFGTFESALLIECSDTTIPSAADFNVLVRELVDMEAALDQVNPVTAKLGRSRAIMSWSVFSSDVHAHAGSLVELRQSDFAHGTLRIRAPGHFVFAESIVFRPNPAHFFGPSPQQRADGSYPFSSFPLDFHAAIGVESDNVLIDLNGYTLSSSVEWHTKQAFGMLIELGNSVFIVGQGPAKFATPFFGPSNVVIRNGVLGFNQHHAIHGNPGSNIYIHDIDMDRYHISPISLNGAKSVMIDRCFASGTNTELSVTGRWSTSHFLDRFLAVAAEVDERVVPKRAHLAELTKQAFDDTVANGRVNAQAHPEAYALFANEPRLVDGNVYGLLLTNHGAAVEQFDSVLDRADAGYRIYVKDYTVRNTVNSVQEAVALIDADGGVVKGPAGDLFPAQRFLNADGTLAEELDPIMDAQLAFASANARYGNGEWNIGSLHVPQPLIDWYDAGADMSQLADLVRANGYRYGRNTDTMFHVDKGAVGMRVDSVYHAKFENVVIDGVEARSPAGHATPLPGEDGPIDVAQYTDSDYGHPMQGSARGYAGHTSRGVITAATDNLYMDGVTVSNVRSPHGRAIDVDTFPHENSRRKRGAIEK